MTVGKQIAICPAMTSHIGNNASHMGNNSHKGNNTIQACLYERNPVLCIICTELLEAFIVGTIDIGWTLPYDTEYKYELLPPTYEVLSLEWSPSLVVAVESLAPTCPVTQTINRRSPTVGFLLKLENVKYSIKPTALTKFRIFLIYPNV